MCTFTNQGDSLLELLKRSILVCLIVAVQETLSKNRASVFANLRSVETGKYLCVALLDIVEWAPADQVYLGTRKALRILLFLTDPTERRKGWGHYTVACIKVRCFLEVTVYAVGKYTTRDRECVNLLETVIAVQKCNTWEARAP